MERGGEILSGDTIYLLFAIIMPLFFLIVAFIFIRSVRKQNEIAKQIEDKHDQVTKDQGES